MSQITKAEWWKFNEIENFASYIEEILGCSNNHHLFLAKIS